MALAALAEIRIGKVRVALSVICVAISVAVVTLVIVLSGLVRDGAQQLFEQQAGRSVTLSVNSYSDKPEQRITEARVDRIRADMRRYRLTGTPLRTTSGTSFRVNGRPLPEPPDGMAGEVYGADANLSRIRRLAIRQGRWLTVQDDLRMEPQLVINTSFAKWAGLPANSAVGKVVEIGAAGMWIKARVVGVFGGGMNSKMPVVLMPYQTMVRWKIGSTQDMTQFVLRVRPEEAKTVTERLRAESTRSWGMAKPAEIQRVSLDFTTIGGTLGKIALPTAVAVLMLGSLPVLALGLVSVRQRRSEFGVHRCFGATGPDLFLTVLTESLITAMTGGVGGILLAYVGQKAAVTVLRDRGPFGQGVQIDIHFPWTAALLGLGVALCVGVLTGLLPALRAMQRSVIRAIRS